MTESKDRPLAGCVPMWSVLERGQGVLCTAVRSRTESSPPTEQGRQMTVGRRRPSGGDQEQISHLPPSLTTSTSSSIGWDFVS